MCHLLLALPALALPLFWLLPPDLAAPTYAVAIAISLAVCIVALKAMRKPALHAAAGMLGANATVVAIGERGLTVQVRGEFWFADAGAERFAIGERAAVVGIEGLRLRVRRPTRCHNHDQSRKPPDDRT